MIQEASGTSWHEMYKVFNMGHRMEVYTNESTAEALIGISKSFGVDAKIIGHVEAYKAKKLTIRSAFGEFVYGSE
jgi:phosphoribosylformylglycinamidine cyclo-ligase